MGDPKSGRKSSAKRRRNRDRRGGDLDDIDEEGYTMKEDVKIDRVFFDRVVFRWYTYSRKMNVSFLSLEANTIEGFAWQHPNIVMNDKNKPQPVKV